MSLKMAGAVEDADLLLARGHLLLEHVQGLLVPLGDDDRPSSPPKLTIRLSISESCLASTIFSRRGRSWANKAENNSKSDRLALGGHLALLGHRLAEQPKIHLQEALVAVLHRLRELVRRHIGMHEVRLRVVDLFKLVIQLENVLGQFCIAPIGCAFDVPRPRSTTVPSGATSSYSSASYCLNRSFNLP